MTSDEKLVFIAVMRSVLKKIVTVLSVLVFIQCASSNRLPSEVQKTEIDIFKQDKEKKKIKKSSPDEDIQNSLKTEVKKDPLRETTGDLSAKESSGENLIKNGTDTKTAADDSDKKRLLEEELKLKAELAAAEIKRQEELEKKKKEEERLEKIRIEKEEQERVRREQEELERLRLEKEREEEEKRRRLERLNKIDPERNYFFRKEAASVFSDTLSIKISRDQKLLIVKNNEYFQLHGNSEPLKYSVISEFTLSDEDQDLTKIVQSIKGNFLLLTAPLDNKGKKTPVVIKIFWKNYRLLNIYSEGKDLILVDAENEKHPHEFYRWSLSKIILTSR